MKQGYLKAKDMNDKKALENARLYRSLLFPKEVFPIIRYRTDRGATHGVVVNMGDSVIVWNAFTEQLEKYQHKDYTMRLIDANIT